MTYAPRPGAEGIDQAQLAHRLERGEEIEVEVFTDVRPCLRAPSRRSSRAKRKPSAFCSTSMRATSSIGPRRAGWAPPGFADAPPELSAPRRLVDPATGATGASLDLWTYDDVQVGVDLRANDSATYRGAAPFTFPLPAGYAPGLEGSDRVSLCSRRLGCMLHAMSRPKVLGLAFGLFALALAPFAVTACDGLKKDGADAAVVVPVAPATTAATPATPDPAATPVAPLGGGVAPTPGGVRPAVAGDAGKPAVAADAAAPADGGKTTPTAAPTPTFQIPTAIPGFDASAFKPPPGFPSTLPTFPPPPAPPK